MIIAYYYTDENSTGQVLLLTVRSMQRSRSIFFFQFLQYIPHHIEFKHAWSKTIRISTRWYSRNVHYMRIKHVLFTIFLQKCIGPTEEKLVNLFSLHQLFDNIKRAEIFPRTIFNRETNCHRIISDKSCQLNHYRWRMLGQWKFISNASRNSAVRNLRNECYIEFSTRW